MLVETPTAGSFHYSGHASEVLRNTHAVKGQVFSLHPMSRMKMRALYFSLLKQPAGSFKYWFEPIRLRFVRRRSLIIPEKSLPVFEANVDGCLK
jgi:hypothetical protein